MDGSSVYGGGSSTSKSRPSSCIEGGPRVSVLSPELVLEFGGAISPNACPLPVAFGVAGLERNGFALGESLGTARVDIEGAGRGCCAYKGQKRE